MLVPWLFTMFVEKDRRRPLKFSLFQGSTVKEADSSREHSRPEKASIHAKRSSVVASLRHKKQASSVEADITNGSALLAQRLPKQEASTASSKKYTFKEGLILYTVSFCVHVVQSVKLLGTC